MAQKPVKIPLKDIHPTEFLLPQDTMDDIASHYDGTPESMKPVMVVGKPGEYYLENGNKKSAFIDGKGHDYVLGFIEDAADFPDDFKDCRRLAKQAEAHGVNTLEDLRNKTVSRQEYDRFMKERDQ